jgi:hypothetical protein
MNLPIKAAEQPSFAMVRPPPRLQIETRLSKSSDGRIITFADRSADAAHD